VDIVNPAVSDYLLAGGYPLYYEELVTRLRPGGLLS